MIELPTLRTRVLVEYWPRFYSRTGEWPRTEHTRMEEMVLVQRESGLLAQDAVEFMPWNGDERIQSTHRVSIEDVVRWLNVPR